MIKNNICAVKWDVSELTSLRLDIDASELEHGLANLLSPQTLAKFSLGLNSNHRSLNSLKEYVLIDNHASLPGWWGEKNNKLFVPTNSLENSIPLIIPHPYIDLPQDSCLFLGCNAVSSLTIWGKGSFLYISNKVSIPATQLAIGGGFVFLGDNIRSMGQLNINCRNNGNIILENDILLSSNVKIYSDDCHTIVSKSTRTRINPYGGSVWIKNHVWIGLDVIVTGNTLINSNNVVGARSFVRGIASPSNALLAGTPARVVKSDITWDQRDLPPDSPDILSIC